MLSLLNNQRYFKNVLSASFISGLFQEYFDRAIEKKTAIAKITEGGSKQKNAISDTTFSN
jgi:hypothetical protein